MTQDLGTKVIIDASQIDLGEYTLLLESYDLNSGVFSTLKSDTVTLQVISASMTFALPEIEIVAGSPDVYALTLDQLE